MNKDRTLLTDARWARLSPLLRGQTPTHGVMAADTLAFVCRSGVLAQARAYRGAICQNGPVLSRLCALHALEEKPGGRVWAALRDEEDLHKRIVDVTTLRAR